MTDHDPVTPEADALDRAIDELLAGRRPEAADRATVRVLEHLAVMHDAPVPPELGQRVRRDMAPQRRGPRLAVRLLAAALGGLFLFQGVPTAFASERLAEFLGFVHEPHVYFEAGVAFLAIGVVLLAGALRRRWLDGAVAIGVPVALVFAVFGMTELPHSPNPSAEVLHFVQGAVAAALAAAWIAARRTNGRSGRDV